MVMKKQFRRRAKGRYPNRGARTRAAAVILLGLCGLGVGAVEAGAGTSRQKAEMSFTTERPSHSTGLRVAIDYRNPQDRDAKPPAVREVVEKLARGGRFDTTVPGQCRASDAELMAQGAQACRRASRVGTGYIRIDTGSPEPNRFIEADVVFLNNQDELIFVSTDRRTGARVVTRSRVDGRKLISDAPPLPGTPPDGAAIDRVQARLRSIDRQGRAYITTPAGCPDDRRWTNKIRFTYADGVTQTVRTANGCR